MMEPVFKYKLQQAFGERADVLGVKIHLNDEGTARHIWVMARPKGQIEPLVFRKIVGKNLPLDKFPSLIAEEVSDRFRIERPDLSIRMPQPFARGAA